MYVDTKGITHGHETVCQTLSFLFCLNAAVTELCSFHSLVLYSKAMHIYVFGEESLHVAEVWQEQGLGPSSV